jgi:hypothetical protein
MSAGWIEERWLGQSALAVLLQVSIVASSTPALQLDQSAVWMRCHMDAMSKVILPGYSKLQNLNF